MNLLKSIPSNSDSKNSLQIIWEIFILSFLQKSIRKAMDLYLTNLLFKGNSGKIKNYVPDQTLWRMRATFENTNREETILINNKTDFQAFLRKNNIPTTQIIAEILNEKLKISADNIIPLNTLYDLKDEIKKLLRYNKSVFIKPTEGTMGDGIIKIDESSLVLDKIDLNRNYIIEKTILQHKCLSDINPSCINTVRAITYRKEHEIFILGSILRMGTGNCNVDNASQGGIFIKYNLQTNNLGEVANSHFKFGGKSFYKHPNSGFVFKDQKLVYSKEVIEMLTKAALLLNSPIIGWDVAYTTEGPVIIEANARPELKLMQISEKGLLKNATFNQVLDTI